MSGAIWTSWIRPGRLVLYISFKSSLLILSLYALFPNFHCLSRHDPLFPNNHGTWMGDDSRDEQHSLKKVSFNIRHIRLNQGNEEAERVTTWPIVGRKKRNKSLESWQIKLWTILKQVRKVSFIYVTWRRSGGYLISNSRPFRTFTP